MQMEARMAEPFPSVQKSLKESKAFHIHFPLRNRILISFVIIAVISTSLLTGITIYLQLKNNQMTTYDKLETIANLKQEEITQWINSLKANMTLIARDPVIKVKAPLVIAQDARFSPGLPLTGDQASLDSAFSTYVQPGDPLADLFLVDAGGNVLLSTNQVAGNINLIQANFSRFRTTGNQPVNSPLIQVSSSDYAKSSLLIIAVPLQDSNHKTVGYLRALASAAQLAAILADNTGLGNTGETYLVSLDHRMVTSTRFKPWQPFGSINSAGIRAALNQTNGQMIYTNYRAYVIGVHHWLPSLQVILMAEMDVSEAYAPTLATIQSILLAAFFTILLAAIGSIFVSNGVARPVNNLVGVARQIADGELTLKADVNRHDEIGYLADVFNRMTDQLSALIVDLEQMVNERTAELEQRTIQIKTAGEVARDIAMADHMNELLNRSVNLIRERFGYYHVGIFLADDQRDAAVLKAATGEAGQELLAQNYQLKNSDVGLVVNVIRTGMPGVMTDTGEDAIPFNHPALPEAHSEMALPLQVGGKVIGALDVHSTLASAFSKDDVDILQTLADQLAVAFQRARLIQQLEENIEELKSTYQAYTKEAWNDFLTKSGKAYHLRYHHSEITAVESPQAEMLEAMSTNQKVTRTISDPDAHPERNKTVVAVPIELRGYVLGAIDLQFQAEIVKPEMINVIQGVANRLALALDNARLLMEVGRRADREKKVLDITSKIRQSNDPQLMIKTAMTELQQVLKASRVQILFQPGLPESHTVSTDRNPHHSKDSDDEDE